MKYIRTQDGRIKNRSDIICYAFREDYFSDDWDKDIEMLLKTKIVKQADTIEELCDCFVKIKRKSNCKPYILKFDYRNLPTLKEQAIKYKDSSVYGAIHIENKGLIYVAKMNEKGELELL